MKRGTRGTRDLVATVDRVLQGAGDLVVGVGRGRVLDHVVHVILRMRYVTAET